MSLAGCQINPIDVNFDLQKNLKFFDKNSAAKNLIQKGRGGKCPGSCQLGLSESLLLHYFSVQSAFPKTKGEHYGRFYLI